MNNLCLYRADFLISNNSDLKNQIQLSIDTGILSSNPNSIVNVSIFDDHANLLSSLSLKSGSAKSDYQKKLDISALSGNFLSVVITRSLGNGASGTPELYPLQINCPQTCATELKNKNLTFKLVSPFTDFYKTGSKGIAHFSTDGQPLEFTLKPQAISLSSPFRFSLQAWVQTSAPGVICHLFSSGSANDTNQSVVLFIDAAGILSLGILNGIYSMGQRGILMDGSWHFIKVEISEKIAMSIDGHVQRLSYAMQENLTLLPDTLLVGGPADTQNTTAWNSLPYSGKFSGGIAMLGISSKPSQEPLEMSYALYTDMLYKGNTSQPIPNALVFLDFSTGQFQDLTGNATLVQGTRDVVLNQIRPSQQNYAVRLLGRTQFVKISAIDAYSSLSSTMTFECWVNTTRGGALFSCGATLDENGDYDASGFRLHIDAAGTLSGTFVDTSLNATPFVTPPSICLTNGSWHHIAVIVQHATLQILIDCRPVYNQSLPDYLTSQALFFGSPPDKTLNLPQVSSTNDTSPDSLQITDILLSEVRIWNIARQQQSLLVDANRRIASSHSDFQSLLGYWTMANAILADESLAANQTQQIVGCQFKSIPVLCRASLNALQISATKPSKFPAGSDWPIGNGAFTLETWIRVASHDKKNDICIFKAPLTGFFNNSYFLLFIPHDSSHGFTVAYHRPGIANSESYFFTSQTSTAILDQNWHHLAITFDGISAFQLYLDGHAAGTAKLKNNSHDNATDPHFLIGYMGSQKWTGEMAELRIWNELRSQPEILQSMHVSLTGTETGLAVLLNFDYEQAIDQVSFTLGIEPGSNTVAPSNPPLRLPNTVFYADGQQAYLDGGAPAALDFSGTKPYTLAAWIRPSQDNASGVYLSRYRRGVQGQYELALSNGYALSQREAQPPADSNHEGWDIRGVTKLQAGQWYFVASTYDGQSLSLYINGNLESSSDYPPIGNDASQCNLWIGAQQDPNGNPERQFQGDIAEVMIWDQAISADIIWAIAARQAAEHPPLPVTWWDFTSAQLSNRGSANIALTPSSTACFTISDFQPGQLTPAMLFNGSDQWITCQSYADMLAFNGQSFSLQCWFKIVPIFNDPVGIRTLLANGQSYQLQTVNAGNGSYNLRFTTHGLSQITLDSTQTAIADGNWHNVVAVYDANVQSKTLYLDGVSIAQSNGVSGTLATSTADRFSIGGNPGDAQSSPFSGFITEVRVWNKALDLASDIEPHLGRKLIGLEDDLVGYWKCTNVVKNSQNSTPLSETDLTNNGNNGIYQNIQDDHVSDLVLLRPLPIIKSYSRLLQTWTATDIAENSKGGTTVYRTIINIIDANGNPMAAEDVRIWSTDPIDLLSGDLAFGISDTLSAQLQTDAKGQITVDTYAESLGVSPLKIWAPFMRSDERVIICPDQNVLANMSVLSGADLKQPRNSQAALLGSDVSDETANSLAQAINSASQTIQPLTPTQPGSPSQASPIAGVSFAESLNNSPFDIAGSNFAESGSYVYTRPVAMAPDTGFSLDYSGYTSAAESNTAGTAAVRFKRMNATDLHEYRNTLLNNPKVKTTRITHTEMFSISHAWHQFVRAVHQAEKVVYHAVEEGVQIVVHWGEDLANEISQFIVTMGHAIGQSIVGLFNQVMNAIKQTAEDFTKKIVAWFQEEFAWNDVLHTKDALKELANNGLNQAIAEMKDLIPQINAYFARLEASAQATFDDMKKAVGGYSFNQLKNAPTANLNPTQRALYTQLATIGSHTGSFSVENSWLPNYTMQHLGSGEIAASSFEQLGNDFIQKATEFIAGLSEQVHFEQVASVMEEGFGYFMQIGQHPDSFGQLALEGFLTIIEGLVLAGLVLANTIIDLLVEIIADTLTAIKSLLNQPIQIPGVSWLYSEIITDGDALTVLDFTCLIAAIPTTYIMKALTGTAPFQDPPPAPTGMRVNQPGFTTLVVQPINHKSWSIMVAYTVLYGIWGILDVILDIQEVVVEAATITDTLRAPELHYGAGSGNEGPNADQYLGQITSLDMGSWPGMAGSGARKILKGLGLAFPCIFQGLSFPGTPGPLEGSKATQATYVENQFFWYYKWLFPIFDMSQMSAESGLAFIRNRVSSVNEIIIDTTTENGYWQSLNQNKVDIMRNRHPQIVGAMGCAWILISSALFISDGVRTSQDDPDSTEWSLFALSNLQNLFEGISPALKILRSEDYVVPTEGGSLVVLAIGDLISDWGAMALNIARDAIVPTE